MAQLISRSVSRPGVSDVTSIAAFGYDLYAATASGRVFHVDMLGNPKRAVRVAGIDGAVSVAAGKEFACAVLREGTVSCWGVNKFYRLGNGKEDLKYRITRPTTVQAAPTHADAGTD